jgi:hypothetical protein
MGEASREIEPEKLHEHSLSPFDRNVAMTIAILSAVLAYVSMISHALTSDRILSQVDINRLQIETNEAVSKRNLAMNEFHEHRSAMHRCQDAIRLIGLLPRSEQTELARVAALKGLAEEIDFDDKFTRSHREEADKIGEEIVAMNAQIRISQDSIRRLRIRGEVIESAELVLQIAIVLCSLAILTKRRIYWRVGMLLGTAGLVLTLLIQLNLIV